MKRVGLGYALLVLLAALLIGCGGGSLNSNGGNHSTGSTDGSNGSTGSGTSGATGATVSAAKGGSVHDALAKAVVVIPAGALSADTKIYVAPPDATVPLPTLPENVALMSGTTYDFKPDGLFFNKNASITLTYSPLDLPVGMPESAVQIYTVKDGAWQPLSGCVVNTTFHTVSAPIAHFTVYAAFCARSLVSGPAYDIVNVGILNGDNASVGLGISSDGKVVGYSTSNVGAVRAFLWQSGTIIDLNRRPSDIGARAICVNSSGLAGGGSIVNSTATFPVLFSYGTVTQVATQFGNTSGAVTSINDKSSYLVGNALNIGGSLTVLSNFTAATGSGALNANNEVAGYADTKAVIWRSAGNFTADLPTGYDIARGTAVSDDETLVGYAYKKDDDTTKIGFVVPSAGGTFVIPALDSDPVTMPTGANAIGQVVGTSTSSSGSTRGFLYAGGITRSLSSLVPSTLGWQITQANGINNLGQIVATGVRNGTSHALLLSPRPGRGR